MKRLLLVLALLVLVLASYTRAALPATESCTGATVDLADPPWIQMNTGGGGSDHVNKDGAGFCGLANDNNDVGVKWATTTDTFGADQYIQWTVKFTGPANGSRYIYAGLRASATAALGTQAGNFYFFWSDGGSDTAILKVIAGTSTQLDSANAFTYASGDTLKIQIVGASFKLFKNGTAVNWTTSGTNSVTDSSISAAGQPWIGGWTTLGGTKSSFFDDVQADNIGGGVTCAPTLALLGVGRCG